MSVTFLVVFFKVNKETFMKLVLFISFQKLFSFSRNSNFRILDIEVSKSHQMPNHKSGNTFHWMTWEVNRLLMEFGKFQTGFRPFCLCKELRKASIGKWNFWSKLRRYVLAKLSKFVQIARRPPKIPFYKGFFEN